MGPCELKRGNERGCGVLGQWVLQLMELEERSFSMSCHFKNYEDDFCWSFTRVYGPTLKVEREGFWSELGAVRGFWSDLWCVVDNFNMIRFPSERSKGGHLSLAMRRFSEVIEDLELRDLPLQGGLFTWSGGLNNCYKSRIDRFLISKD